MMLFSFKNENFKIKIIFSLHRNLKKPKPFINCYQSVIICAKVLDISVRFCRYIFSFYLSFFTDVLQRQSPRHDDQIGRLDGEYLIKPSSKLSNNVDTTSVSRRPSCLLMIKTKPFSVLGNKISVRLFSTQERQLQNNTAQKKHSRACMWPKKSRELPNALQTSSECSVEEVSFERAPNEGEMHMFSFLDFK